jgi:hypothetical protein
MLYRWSSALNGMVTNIKTEPGTEENLQLEVDAHPFDEVRQRMSQPHPVLVDGIRGVASVGSHGGYSTRIVVSLEEEHPDLGTEFVTKYFIIDTPGIVKWGHDGKSFSIEKIIEE